MRYTINDQAPSYYSVEDITFNFATMRTDTATCHLGKNWDENAPNFFGQWVEIKGEGTRIFYGVARTLSRNASPTDQHLSVVVDGPWQYLEDTIYSELYTYADGEYLYTSRVTLGGRTLTDQVVRILQTQSQIIDISGIDLPNINMPEEEVVDLSTAEVLRRALRWAPGCIVYFNYERTGGPGFEKPKINILQRGSSTLNVRNVKTGDHQGLQSFVLKEDAYPSIGGVRIRYELPVTKVDAETGEEESSIELVDTDDGGNFRTNRSHDISKTVRLSGRRIDTTYKYTLVSSCGNHNADYYMLSDENLYNYCASQFNDHPGWPYADVSRYVFSWGWGPITDTNRTDATKLIFFAQEDELPEYNLRYSDDFRDGIQLWRWDITVGYNRPAAGGSWYKQFKVYGFDAYNRQGNVNRYGQTIQNTLKVYDEDTETPPSGAAGQYYNTLQEHRYKGRITFLGKSGWFFNGWTNYLSIRNQSNTEIAQGQIQSINIKGFNDLATVQIGTPDHLDFSSIMRLARIS